MRVLKATFRIYTKFSDTLPHFSVLKYGQSYRTKLSKLYTIFAEMIKTDTLSRPLKKNVRILKLTFHSFQIFSKIIIILWNK